MKARVPTAYSKLSPSEKEKIQQYIKDVASDAAEEYSDQLIKARIGDIAQCCVMLSLIVLIREFGWGTDNSKTHKPLKIQQFVEKYGEEVELYSNDYGEAMIDALEMHLHDMGVDIDQLEEKNGNK